jgi:eukaryotic-like serine/threonine-protein kinase
VEVVLSAGPAAVEMPEVVGRDLDEAQALLTGEPYHFDLAPVEERHHHAAPAGRVIEQAPDAGEEALQGDAVELVVSAGPATVEMPEVVGRDRDDAESLLTGEPYHLEIGQIDERFDDHAPAGEVVEQVPAPGEELLQGDTVELTVSKGIEQVEVPDLAGKTRDEAEAALDDAQLGADFVDEYSDEVPTPGRVAEQSVAAGSEVDKGSTVVVTISRGPLTFPIPRVEGKPVEGGRGARPPPAPPRPGGRGGPASTRGRCRPFSTAPTSWRLTPARAASPTCVRPRAVRSARSRAPNMTGT